MPKKPRPPLRFPRVPLTAALILEWADAYHGRTGRWPKADSGAVPSGRAEKWANLDRALRAGGRGLPGGDSRARLLRRERGVRNRHDLPPLTEGEICRWAEAHHRATGRWPTETSGPVGGAAGEGWLNVNAALRDGPRGLPGSESLAELLARRRGARNRTNAPPLTEARIRAWAADHERRTGKRPTTRSGPVFAAPGEAWALLDVHLRAGGRGLPGGSSLTKLLSGAGPTG